MKVDPFTWEDLDLDLVDGLIYHMPSNHHTEFINFVRGGLPLVLIGHYPEAGEVTSVGINNFVAGKRVTEHLVSLGRRRIIGVWPFDEQIPLTRLRSNGFCECLAENGLSPASLIYMGIHSDMTSSYWMIKDVISSHTEFDGIVFGSYMMAQGGLLALNESGIKVPKQVSVVTIDDHISNRMVKPTLTALRISIPAMLTLATQRLLALIDGTQTDPTHDYIETELMVRESCGAGQIMKS